MSIIQADHMWGHLFPITSWYLIQVIGLICLVFVLFAIAPDSLYIKFNAIRIHINLIQGKYAAVMQLAVSSFRLDFIEYRQIDNIFICSDQEFVIWVICLYKSAQNMITTQVGKDISRPMLTQFIDVVVSMGHLRFQSWINHHNKNHTSW